MGRNANPHRRAPRRKASRAPAGASAPGAPGDRAATVRHIRAVLGRTQNELATALGVSGKAVQSYEQGWRDVPVRVMIQLLVLLSLYRRHTAMDEVPCWELRKCTADQRQSCASFTVGRGQFCWFMGSTDCRPPAAGNADPALPCMGCPVVQRLLGETSRDATGSGG